MKKYILCILILISSIILTISFLCLMNNEKYKEKPKVTKSFFINLERMTDRKKYMENQFNKQNMNVERFIAFDKNKLNKNLLEKLKNINIISKNYNLLKASNISNKKIGSIACLISHTNLYKKILNDYKRGIFLIFEDDCTIDNEFNKKLDYYLNNLPKKMGYDMARI